MNAIERLRDRILMYGEAPSEMEALAALAAVDALYQAAKEAASPTTPDGPAAPFMWKPANDALAAAVRRVEGESTTVVTPEELRKHVSGGAMRSKSAPLGDRSEGEA